MSLEKRYKFQKYRFRTPTMVVYSNNFAPPSTCRARRVIGYLAEHHREEKEDTAIGYRVSFRELCHEELVEMANQEQRQMAIDSFNYKQVVDSQTFSVAELNASRKRLGYPLIKPREDGSAEVGFAGRSVNKKARLAEVAEIKAQERAARAAEKEHAAKKKAEIKAAEKEHAAKEKAAAAKKREILAAKKQEKEAAAIEKAEIKAAEKVSRERARGIGLTPEELEEWARAKALEKKMRSDALKAAKEELEG
jgi:hypothetical protein